MTGPEILLGVVLVLAAVLLRERWRISADVAKSKGADWSALDARVRDLEEKSKHAGIAQLSQRQRPGALPFGG